MGPPWLGQEKTFKQKISEGSKMLYSDWCLQNTIFHKRAILLILKAEFTESVLTLSCTKSTMGPPWLDPEKNFQSISFHTDGKHYFEFDSWK